MKGREVEEEDAAIVENCRCLMANAEIAGQYIHDVVNGKSVYMRAYAPIKGEYDDKL